MEIATPTQWLMVVSPQGIKGDIDTIYTKITTPRRSNLKNLGTSFWISAEWGRHFAQVGLSDSGDGKFRAFYASTLDLTDPRNRLTVKVHTFKIPKFSHAKDITLRIEVISEDETRLSILPRNARITANHSTILPIGRKIDKVALVLEAFDQASTTDWNRSTWRANTPKVNTNLKNGQTWPHARPAFEGVKTPPKYMGISLMFPRSLNIKPRDTPTHLTMGHIGDYPNIRNRLW